MKFRQARILIFVWLKKISENKFYQCMKLVLLKLKDGLIDSFIRQKGSYLCMGFGPLFKLTNKSINHIFSGPTYDCKSMKRPHLFSFFFFFFCFLSSLSIVLIVAPTPTNLEYQCSHPEAVINVCTTDMISCYMQPRRKKHSCVLTSHCHDKLLQFPSKTIQILHLPFGGIILQKRKTRPSGLKSQLQVCNQ